MKQDIKNILYEKVGGIYRAMSYLTLPKHYLCSQAEPIQYDYNMIGYIHNI